MATSTWIEQVQAKKNRVGRIDKVETSCVQDNPVLSLSVNRQDVDRCVKLIRQYGLLTPPVVGALGNGSQIVLSGECEFLALREIGIKSLDAVTVPIEESDEGDKLSLLLSSLKKSPNALSEGILINQLFSGGQYTQSQLGELLGKSVSWVNKRISLVTRLAPPVMELVRLGQVCPHSAQEISRLPAEVQHSFSITVVKDGLPKSSVETLVAAFNAPGCPDEIRAQIVSDPRQTLSRLSDGNSPIAIRQKAAAAPFFPREKAGDEISRFRRQLAVMKAHLSDAIATNGVSETLLRALRSDVSVVLSLLNEKLPHPPWRDFLGEGGHGD